MEREKIERKRGLYVFYIYILVMTCLEGRQGRLKHESEENRGKAESFQVRLSVRRTLLLFVVNLTLTDPIRIKPLSQNRQNQTNQAGNMFREKKQGKQTEENRQERASKRI